jgi:hypothetical protein
MRSVGLAATFFEASVTQQAVPDVSFEELPAHVRANTPAILRGHLDGWPPCSLWSGEYIAAECAGHTVRVRLMDTTTGLPVPPQLPGEKYECVTMLASSVITTLQDAARAGGRSHLYAAQQQLRHTMPGLARDARPPPAALAALGAVSRSSPAAYFGVGSRTPVHWDAPENLLCVVRGRKNLTLWHPGHGDALQGRHGDGQAAVLESRVVLSAGDALYIPSCWWHEVSSPCGEVCMSVSYWAEPPPGKRDEKYCADEIGDHGQRT